jgi:iron complex outermembrane receptor protein
MQLFSGFAQDEIALIPDKLRLTLGTKLEHNDFSGFEVQPTARLAWTLTSRQTFWGAISRAVRSPSRFDADERTPFLNTPGGDFDSEKALSYELGYRVRPLDRLSLSTAVFFDQYTDLRSIDTNPNPPPQLAFANHQHADTWGLELSGDFEAADWWRLRGGYTYFEKNIWAATSSVLAGSDQFEGLDSHHQFLVQSIMDLPAHFQFDTVARYTSTVPSSVLPTPEVPAYFSLDLRVAWRYKNIEASLVGQNLLDDLHPEFGPLQMPRGVYGKIALRF